MKIYKWAVVAMGIGMLTSCADYFDTNEFVVEKPGSNADYEYLAEYEPLKNYLDRSAHPNFKVSAALAASDFNKKSDLFTLARSNFDEVVAGNAMKMGSVYKDAKGTADFTTVSKFVAAAEAGGMTIYGHTLAWHSQQPVKWLSSLIADKPVPTDPSAPVTPSISYIVDRDFESADQKIGGWGNSSTQEVADGVLVLTNPSVVNFWEAQAAIDMPEPFANGETYTLKMKVRSDANGNLRVGFQNPDNYAGCGDFAPVALTSEWKDVALECTISGDNAKRFIFSFGDIAGQIYLDDLKLFAGHIGDDEAVVPSAPTKEIIIERSFESAGDKIGGWGNSSTQEVTDGVLVLTNPSVVNFWEAQAAVDMPEPFENGETYTLMMRVRSDAAGNLRVGFQNPENYAGCGDFAPITLSPSWQDVALECAITGDNAKRFIFSFGDIAGKIFIDDLVLYKGKLPEYDYTIYVDRDFESAGDKIGGWGNSSTQEVIDGVLVLTNPSQVNSWEAQIAVDFNEPIPNGTVTTMEIKAKASAAMNLAVGFQNPDGYAGQGDFPALGLTTEWQNFKVDCTVNGDGAKRFIFSYGQHAGKVYIDDLKLYTKTEKVVGGGPAPSVKIEKTITENKPTLVVTSSDLIEFGWDTQFWVVANNEFSEGDKYEFSADVRADLPAKASTQVHGEPGDYHFYIGVGDVNFSTEWETYKNEGTLQTDNKGGRSIAFNLNEFASANKYYFRNISFKINGVEQITNGGLTTSENKSFSSKESKGVVDKTIFNTEIVPSISYTVMVDSNTIPMTPEEKKEALLGAMKQWVYGIMEATEGKVKAWDLINEAVAGSGNVNGYYDLQHFDGYESGTWDVGGEAFYWQDYFGSEEYGVIMEKLAREAYAAQEGTNPADLKLFINDYNLESTWDDNKKLASLIYWIGVWEKGGAKIDGIGTQMHISYFRNANDQENQKKHITEMFEEMAKTGKLVRVSELDMGIAETQSDAFQNKMIPMSQITLADEKAMADYYQWIIEEYFRIVPAPQQYGICQWCLTDAAPDSGWRAGQPVGLWYQDYSRKPAYAGWAEGLKK